MQDGEASSDDRAITGRLGFMYLADVGISPYINYSTSFLPTVGKTVEGVSFIPEEGKQYEAGLKWGDAGETVQLTAAVFDITRENVLTRHPTIDGAQVQNGSQQHRGFEIESTISLWDRWVTTITYAWLEAEITESFDAGVKGNIPQEVPEKTASLWAQYYTAFNPDLSFSFGVSHESFSYGNPENTVYQPGFTLYEAGAHYALDKWSFSLTGSNLTNEHYFNSCWNGNYCARSEPRLISGRAAYKW